MQSNISLKWSLFIIGIVGFALSPAVFFYLASPPIPENQIESGSEPPNTQSSSLQPQIPQGLAQRGDSFLFPLRLKIPKIHVDTGLEYVGLTPDGAMDVPKGPTDAALFDLGPRPGETGSAVIAGHYGWKDGISAVFDNLHTLVAGDKIYVEGQNGTTITFIVRESQKFGEGTPIPNVFSSTDGKAHLNLITCGGTWDKVAKSYSNRIIVFTDKEEPEKLSTTQN